MRSIRASLIVGTVLATGAVIAVAGTMVYRGARAALVRQVDEGLEAEAQLLASTVKTTPEGFELGFDELDMREFGPENTSGYLQLWLDDGRVLFRSPGLAEHDLERVDAEIEHPIFHWTRVVGNTPARAIALRFQPIVDKEEDEPGAEDREPPDLDLAGGSLVLARDATEVSRLLARLRTLLVAAGLLSTFLATGILSAVIRRSLRPLDSLADQIGRLSDNDLSSRVTLPSTPREMEPVVNQLNELLGRLQTVFERERTLSADIAHELRTPLAGLRATIEVSLSRPRSGEDASETLADSLQMVRRLQSMVETLLYLSRLDAGQVRTERQAVDLRELVEAAWKPLAEGAAARNISPRWRFADTVRVSTDPILLEVVIRNLLDNAVAYVDQGGTVSVEVASRNGRGVLSVLNSGSKVAQDRVEDLLRPFARGDESRKASGEHFGLGLALVTKIAAVVGASVDIRSRVDGDFEVILSLPAA